MDNWRVKVCFVVFINNILIFMVLESISMQYHSVESVGHVVGVCLAHPEHGEGKVVVVGGVPVVLGHKANSAPLSVASSALSWSYVNIWIKCI